MDTEPFTIPAHVTRQGDIIAVAHEMSATRTDAHRHCIFVVDSSDMTPDSEETVWDEDCEELIAYIPNRDLGI